jgi:hypothetical protein
MGPLAHAQDIQQPQASPQVLVAKKADDAPLPADSPSNTAVEETQSEGAALPASFIRMVEIGQKYDKYNPWDWTAARFPSTGDTLSQEAFGLRENLGKKRIGFLYMYQTEFFDNLKNPPMYGANGPDASGKYYDGGATTVSTPFGLQTVSAKPNQWYYGQRPTYVENMLATVTYNPGSNTQFVFQMLDGITNFGMGTQYNSPRIAGLYMNQAFMNRKLVISAGYVSQGFHTGGFFLDGNVAGSLLGNNAILQGIEGQASPFAVTPSIDARYNVTRNGYVLTAVGSSTNPLTPKAPMSALAMPFAPHGAKANITQEFGYQRASAPGERKLWARIDGLYNFTHYPDWRTPIPMTNVPVNTPSGTVYLQTPVTTNTSAGAIPLPSGRTDNNWGVSAAFDYQMTAPDSILFFRGNYIGATAQYIPPEQNIYSQYYEFRDYYIGLFKKRPIDMLSVVANHLGFSKPWLKAMAPITNPSWGLGDTLQVVGSQNGVPVFGAVPNNPATYDTGQQSYSVSYLAHVHNGLWFLNTLMYTTHPTPFPKTPNSLVYCGALSFFF